MKKLAILPGLLLVLSFGAWGQTPTGAVEGVVTDPTGAVIPGAIVASSEAGTGRNITLTSNAEGFYSVRNLLPGSYTVKVSAAGFAAQEIKDVRVDSGAVVNANVKLEIGRTGDVIEISAQAVAVDTTRQTVDTVIEAA